jgi:hypothetical protein
VQSSATLSPISKRFGVTLTASGGAVTGYPSNRDLATGSENYFWVVDNPNCVLLITTSAFLGTNRVKLSQADLWTGTISGLLGIHFSICVIAKYLADCRSG